MNISINIPKQLLKPKTSPLSPPLARLPIPKLLSECKSHPLILSPPLSPRIVSKNQAERKQIRHAFKKAEVKQKVLQKLNGVNQDQNQAPSERRSLGRSLSRNSSRGKSPKVVFRYASPQQQNVSSMGNVHYLGIREARTHYLLGSRKDIQLQNSSLEYKRNNPSTTAEVRSQPSVEIASTSHQTTMAQYLPYSILPLSSQKYLHKQTSTFSNNNNHQNQINGKLPQNFVALQQKIIKLQTLLVQKTTQHQTLLESYKQISIKSDKLEQSLKQRQKQLKDKERSQELQLKKMQNLIRISKVHQSQRERVIWNLEAENEQKGRELQKCRKFIKGLEDNMQTLKE